MTPNSKNNERATCSSRLSVQTAASRRRGQGGRATGPGELLGRGAQLAAALVVFAVGIVIATVWGATATYAAPPLRVTVTTAPGAASDLVNLSGQTYAAAKAAIAARTASVTLPVALTGFHDLVSADAVVSTDDTKFAIALQGSTTLLGKPAKLLVTASWADGSTTTANVAVLVRFEAVGLETINPSWKSVPVAFGPALIGLTDKNQSVAPNSVLGTDKFLTDGLAATDDTFVLTGGGVNLQAVITSGPVSDAAAELGAASTGIRVRGSLAASLGVLDGSASGAGLQLAVDLPVATPKTFPKWISLSAPWTLGIKADSTGAFTASFLGGVVVEPDGKTPISAQASATVMSASGQTSLALSVDVGTVNDLFGQTWLDLQQTNVAATITKDAFAGSFKASLTIGTTIADVALAVDASSATIKGSLDITAAGPVSTADLLNALGAANTGFDPSLVNLSVTKLALHASVDAPKGGNATITVAAFAESALTMNGGSLNSHMLFRIVSTKGASTDVLVAARLTGPTLKQLSPDIAFDWKLPDVDFVVSTTDHTISYASLDQPTQQYFAPELCDAAGTCADLIATKGVKLQALIEFPADMVSELKNLGINVTGPLHISGTLPVLGGSQVSLKIALPTIQGDANALVKQGTVSFSIAFDTKSKAVTASIDGNMVFRITRSGPCDATAAGTWPGQSTCYDELNLTVAAAVSASPSGGVQISLSGQIDEWNHAFGVSWLKVNTLRLQLGLSAGGGSSVAIDIGMLGRLTFQPASNGGTVLPGTTPTKDLTLAIKLAITPTPPWIELTGFTLASGDGIGLREVARFFSPNLNTDQLPDLSLKNLWLAYGTHDDPSLCIRQGLYISAELHLGAPTSSNATPGCIPNQTLPSSADQLPTAGCESANTCIAAVLFDVQTGNAPGITAAGFIRQFDAGPLHFESTKLLLELSPTAQRLYFSGSATLSDPTTPTIKWAGASVTIDFSNNRGAVSMFVDGTFNAGGDQGLSVRASGKVAVDFTKLGTANYEAFLSTLQFDLQFEATLPAVTNLGPKITDSFQPVTQYVNTIGPAITNAFDPNLNPDLAALKRAFGTLPPLPIADPNYTQLLNVEVALTGSATKFNAQVEEVRATVAKYLGNPNDVTTQTTKAINAYGGLTKFLLHGGTLRVYQPTFGLLNPIDITSNGACNNTIDGPLCEGTEPVKVINQTVITPVVASQYKLQTGFTLPKPTESLAAMKTLGPIVKTPATATVNCLTTIAHYGPSGNREDAVVANVTAYGQSTTISANMDLASSQSVAKATAGAALDNLVSKTQSPVPCARPNPGAVVPVGDGGTTIKLQSSTVDEGPATNGASVVHVTGVAAAAYRNKTVTLVWGDGSTTIVPIANDGNWKTDQKSDHGYRDDAGAGPTTTYTITAQAAGAATKNAVSVVVRNVAPVVTVTPPSLAKFDGTATLSGTFTDPGVLDDHVVTVSWGDGTTSTSPLAANVLTFQVSHVYSFSTYLKTHKPIPVKAQVTFPIQVEVTDKDGGKASRPTEMRVVLL